MLSLRILISLLLATCLSFPASPGFRFFTPIFINKDKLLELADFASSNNFIFQIFTMCQHISRCRSPCCFPNCDFRMSITALFLSINLLCVSYVHKEIFITLSLLPNECRKRSRDFRRRSNPRCSRRRTYRRSSPGNPSYSSNSYPAC